MKIKLKNINLKLSDKIFILSLISVFVFLTLFYLFFYISNGNFIILLIVSLFILASLYFALKFVVKKIINPLFGIIESAKSVAEGDLSNIYEYYGNDEFGELSQNINQVLVQFQNIIESITGSAESFTLISNSLSENSKNILSGAMQESESVNNVATSMQEMISVIKQNSEVAQKTEEIAFKASSGAEEGSEKIYSTVSMLKRIADKINIITDIAFQTNILSLNASIQAARAGKHGKSFGVVAVEVGNLATKSKDSAEEIEELSDESMKLADTASSLFKELIENIQETYNLVIDITVASTEQEDGANQVNMSIEKLREVTLKNTDTAAQLASNSEQLSEHAQMLNEIVEYFKSNET